MAFIGTTPALQFSQFGDLPLGALYIDLDRDALGLRFAISKSNNNTKRVSGYLTLSRDFQSLVFDHIDPVTNGPVMALDVAWRIALADHLEASAVDLHQVKAGDVVSAEGDTYLIATNSNDPNRTLCAVGINQASPGQLRDADAGLHFRRWTIEYLDGDRWRTLT